MSPHYPADYYSFGAVRAESRFRRFLQRRRAQHVLAGRNLVGRFMVNRYGVPPTLDHVARARLSGGESILEIGCGAGERLLALRAYGFTDLTGLDPYVDEGIDYGNGVRVLKRDISAHVGAYDFVTLHHAFEHVADPAGILGHIHRLLRGRRLVLLRIPVGGSHAFRTYGADWVQLDAPRHFYLHTRKSIDLLAAQSGFEVEDVVYDSTAFQFWGSEQYRMDIPLRDGRSYAVNPGKSLFSKAQIESYEAKARELNETGEGDQACFYLRKK